MAITWDCIGTFGTDTGWATAGNWPTGGVPLAGEHALIESMTNAIVGSDQSAADLGTVWFGPGCTKQVGSPGSPLILATNVLVIEGSGEKWIKAGNDINYVYINMADPSQRVYLFPNTSQYLDNVYIQQGNVTIVSETAATLYAEPLGPGATLTISASSGGVTTLRNRGTVVSRALVGTLYNEPGGVFTQESDATATVTNAYVAGGSTFNFDYGGSGITVALCVVGPGAVANFDRTRTNKTVTAYAFAAGSDVRAGGHVTLTTTIYGGY